MTFTNKIERLTEKKQFILGTETFSFQEHQSSWVQKIDVKNYRECTKTNGKIVFTKCSVIVDP